MTENKLEQDIIKLYDSNLVSVFSINQISKKLNKKYPYINKKINDLLKHKIMSKIVIGKSHLCGLNFFNDKTHLLLSLNEINKKSKVKQTDAVTAFINRSFSDMCIHSVIFFDNTLVFVVDDLKQRRTIEKKFPESIIVDKEELIDLIIENKQLYSNHTVIYGNERFFELIKHNLDEIKRCYSPLRY